MVDVMVFRLYSNPRTCADCNDVVERTPRNPGLTKREHVELSMEEIFCAKHTTGPLYM